MLWIFRALTVLLMMLNISACSATAANVKPQNPMVEAQSYYDRALYSDAERVLLKLSERVEDNYDVHFMLGNIYVRTGQYPAADRMYRRCINIDSSVAKAWYNLALLKVKEAMSLADEGYQRTAVDNPEYERNFLLLKDGLITAITGQ
ncbi:tetratricopeptide repeat protein [Zhongshania sp.]|jgi:tetratricopeptide (TPR) repeat protein|uniref:tetratricopeptide repeat protein n=1 Tax=Zhongshania sp. TaxID=1971902 RepID=UPI001B760D8F|nr:tetratricopeptide repeat protein [Zhongshania sp.]MBQ0794637.1 hypothetical protein [Zhongshania sp.]|tara:strand:+ start:148017 stop:148460 length:444 start_codon:yes stop_codon:yes gene_type:complete